MNHRWKLTLTLRGPLLTKSTAPGAYGLDALMARDGQDRPYLPGTLIKGRLRQAWEELGLATERMGPDRIVGREESSLSNTPQRGTIHFCDLTCPPAKGGVTYRVAIDAVTGAAKDQALLMAETPFASGELVDFTGEVDATASDAEALERDLLFGLHWMTHVGSNRGCGFGRITHVTLEKIEEPIEDTIWFDARGIAGIQIVPLSPFCFAKHRTKENIFESQDSIPGAAVKGCLAEQYSKSDRPVPAWFDRLRVTHAFPAEEESETRPVVLPHSLVMNDAKAWYDATLKSGPFLFDGADAPKYAPDWKPSAESLGVLKHFGWATPSRQLRVRTAIDRSTQRAAEEHLFAQELVDPQGCAWQGRIDASALNEAEREELATELRQGLRGLGKTKARARVRPSRPIDTIGVHREASDLLVIVLQTPAVLLDPRGLDKAENRHPALLKERYANALSESLGAPVKLSHFYATQSLAGGNYLWRRFQAQEPYHPWLLTDAGSVFVLQTEAAQNLAERWHGGGLTLPSWTHEAYGLKGEASDWQRCPYLPENGYGEVACNLAVHWSDHHTLPPSITDL